MRDPTTTTNIPKRKLPVLIFIRGGSFNVGTANSSIFSPIYLLNQDIVLVTFNYRLNFLGELNYFLHLSRHNVPETEKKLR